MCGVVSVNPQCYQGWPYRFKLIFSCKLMSLDSNCIFMLDSRTFTIVLSNDFKMGLDRAHLGSNLVVKYTKIYWLLCRIWRWKDNYGSTNKGKSHLYRWGFMISFRMLGTSLLQFTSLVLLAANLLLFNGLNLQLENVC